MTRPAGALLQPRLLTVLLGAGSVFMLLAAAVFEHWFGLAPCAMCLWQRWPHRLVAALGALALVAGGAACGPAILRPALGLMSAALLAGAGIAFWHAGVEYGFLPGPAACGGPAGIGGDAAAALDTLLATRPVRCDEAAWSFLGVSMAGWNGLASLAMAGLACRGFVRYHAGDQGEARR